MGFPPASFSECCDSVWITKELFLKWFRYFVAFSEATPQKPVSLIFDGHANHTKNIDLIEEARKTGFILFCLPPHCSHKLQPLDIYFMKPLSKFLRGNLGKVVTLAHIASLFGTRKRQQYQQQSMVLGKPEFSHWTLTFFLILVFSPHEQWISRFPGNFCKICLYAAGVNY